MKALRTWLVVAGLLVAACGGASSGSSNSETHFLGLCSADECGEGLSCICGVCTVKCDPAASCGALNGQAICTSSSSSCGDDAEPSVCDVDCEDDGDCTSLGSEFRCQSGVCRPPGCVYEGRVYKKGTTFDAPNSTCNTCTCDASGEVTCTRAACPEGCEYDGASYELGDEFPSTDGCNSCSCTYDGVVCTDAACAGTCDYGGQTYPVGASFPATDGCNSCSCEEDGAVLCSEIGCVAATCIYDGVTYQVGDYVLRDCGVCTCSEGGSLACDEAVCGGCQAGNRFYEFGDSYLAEDGCNTCTCDENGGSCSQRGCSTPECLLPFEVGSCDAAIPVFYYNPETFRCEERVYGGCDGNANRFESLEACQQHCTEIDTGD